MVWRAITFSSLCPRICLTPPTKEQPLLILLRTKQRAETMGKCWLASSAAMGEDTGPCRTSSHHESSTAQQGKPLKDVGLGSEHSLGHGGTMEFLPVPRGKMYLPDICCQATTAGQEQHGLGLALGSACAQYVRDPGKFAGKIQALSMHWQEIRYKVLPVKSLPGVPLGWKLLGDAGRWWGPWDAWPQPELEETSMSHLPHLHPKQQQPHNINPGKCFQPTLSNPSASMSRPTSWGSDLHHYPHQSLRCLLPPPSQSIKFRLSSSVLLCSFFCSLPACSFSNPDIDLFLLQLWDSSELFNTFCSSSSFHSFPPPRSSWCWSQAQTRLWKAIGSESLSKLCFPSWKESRNQIKNVYFN